MNDKVYGIALVIFVGVIIYAVSGLKVKIRKNGKEGGEANE